MEAAAAFFIAQLVREAITHAVIAKRLITGEAEPDSSRGKGQIRRRIKSLENLILASPFGYLITRFALTSTLCPGSSLIFAFHAR
jgi:hypothetical protein